MSLTEITAVEASVLVEVTTDALYRRVRWSIGHEGMYRSQDIDWVQGNLRALSTLHTKAWMVIRDDEEDDLKEFVDAFMIPDEIWDLIDEITSVAGWEQVPRHLHSPTLCRVCRILAHEASNAQA